MSARSPRFIADGNINPSRFVKIESAGTTGYEVLQAAAATDRPIGISQEGTRQPPGVVGSDGYAAHAGETLQVYGEAEEALLTIGSGGCTQGDYLKSDGSGQGVTVSFTEGTGLLFYGAVALETANSGELARVLVKCGPVLHCTA
jgi:hypothetical protein